MSARLTLIFLLSLLQVRAGAQSPIPFLFTSEDENRLIKENDSFKYYVASGDTTCVVAINEDASLYKLYSKDHKLIAQGNFVAEGDKDLQDGKWELWYMSGKIKCVGSYRKGLPIGTWEEYYPSGKLKVVSNYGIFDEHDQMLSGLCGSYTEYNSDGKVKASGFYSAHISAANDTVTVNDPVTGNDVQKVLQRKKLTSAKVGHWEYYDENGELERAEDL